MYRFVFFFHYFYTNKKIIRSIVSNSEFVNRCKFFIFRLAQLTPYRVINVNTAGEFFAKVYQYPCFKSYCTGITIARDAVAIMIKLYTDINLLPQVPGVGNAEFLFIKVCKTCIVYLETKISLRGGKRCSDCVCTVFRQHKSPFTIYAHIDTFQSCKGSLVIKRC